MSSYGQLQVVSTETKPPSVLGLMRQIAPLTATRVVTHVRRQIIHVPGKDLSHIYPVNVFSHWSRPCSAIERKKNPVPANTQRNKHVIITTKHLDAKTFWRNNYVFITLCVCRDAHFIDFFSLDLHIVDIPAANLWVSTVKYYFLRALMVTHNFSSGFWGISTYIFFNFTHFLVNPGACPCLLYVRPLT